MKKKIQNHRLLVYVIDKGLMMKWNIGILEYWKDGTLVDELMC
jgi:hypothetical protein